MTVRERNIKLFVGNLPFDATEDDILSFLHGCGQIRYLSIRRDNYTNKSKGYAHLEYKTEAESVEAFKRLIGKEVRGRVLKLDFCDDFLREKYQDLLAASVYAQEQAAQQVPPELREPQVPLFVPPGQLPEVIPHPPLLGPPPQGLPVLPQIPVPPIPTVIQPTIPVHLPVNIPVSVPVQVTTVPPVPVPQPPPVPLEYSEVKPEPKRHKLEPDVLIQNGKVVNKDLFYIIKRMSMLDVYKLVKKIDSLMERSPNTARSILNSSPYMRSALVHAKLLLGYKDLNFTNLSNVDFSNLLEYFVIH